MQRIHEFYGHGKLLLTGEYFVLDGATALAIPTRAGQRFTVGPLWGDLRYDLEWIIDDNTDEPRRELFFLREEWHSAAQPPRDPVRARLLQLLRAAEQLRLGCTEALYQKKVTSRLEFPPDWGLGSSSTLVYFLGRLLDVNPYKLLELSFGGSGYDLACAGAAQPLLYRRMGHYPEVKSVSWNPAWVRKTYFVHLNRKQNSREGIAAYRNVETSPRTLGQITQLTLALVNAPDLRTAARILTDHEKIVASTLELQPVKERLFRDFPGTVKSLGAWGGDFVWALSELAAEKVQAYFNERGYGTVIPFNEMIWPSDE
ncbi:GYDIA family GHMP kinase [Lewinella sp. JB7]|uniref:GYDIA family GHMP kinase n=1 Tax=Lewinella sp. JB7 TaxID=2962887 RepID=UPI0020C9CA16|nr:GYDIA family GHMP kinase [Lewinella sp. JB7]MCP9237850.1 GYDIA family GHMP kinase [Lewinella sp. JB7]